MTNKTSTKHSITPILVSACLLGIPCRYDGKSKAMPDLLSYNKQFSFIPFCPEEYGGLSTPRVPAEIQSNGRVMTRDGIDVTEAYQKGAARAVALCHDFHIQYAILKSRSPSCGPNSSYDGTFSKVLCKRPGLTAQALKCAGIIVFSEEDFPQCILSIKQNRKER